MTDQEFSRAIAAIDEVYARANAPRPTLERPITPLGELVGCFNLTWQELPHLTGATAIAFLRERAGAFDIPRNVADERLAGFLYATPRYGNIFVEQDDRLTRRRFSIAHELGHYLLHVRPYFANHVTGEDDVPLSIVESLPTDGEREEDAQLQGRLMLPTQGADGADQRSAEETALQREEEANRFAAMLLMPTDIVTALTRKYESEMRDDDLVWRLASEMLVSRAAVDWRLHDLHLLPTKRKSDPGSNADALN